MFTPEFYPGFDTIFSFFCLNIQSYLLLLENLNFDWTQTSIEAVRESSLYLLELFLAFLVCLPFTRLKVQHILQPLPFIFLVSYFFRAILDVLCCRIHGVTGHRIWALWFWVSFFVQCLSHSIVLDIIFLERLKNQQILLAFLSLSNEVQQYQSSQEFPSLCFKKSPS